MEREVHKSRSFEAAAAWDRRQQQAMTPDQRFEVVRILRERVFGADAPDVREVESDSGRKR
jgi:hypothetical protein